MTVEEALVALLTLVAGLLLFVGLAQALDSRRPARSRRAARGRVELARRRVPESALERHGRGPRVPPPRRPESEPGPAPAPKPVQMVLPQAPEQPAVLEPVVEEAAAEQVPAPEVPAAEAAAPEVAAAAPRETELAEACMRLYQEGEYAQVLEAAGPALRSESEESSPPATPCERAALWGLVGLAGQAVGDRDGARQAFEAGLACAPGPEGPAPSPRGMLLAVPIARHIVMGAETATGPSPDMTAGLSLACALVAAAAVAEPGDEGLRELGTRARNAAGALVERRAAALLDRRELAEASCVIQEALQSPDLPPGRRQALCDLLWTAVTGEVGRLTGQALEATGEVGEALLLLDRAEEAVRRVPQDALTPEQAEDLRRRLWWGHTKLGIERIEAGDPAGALPPLYRALGLREMDAERQTQARRALARALEAVAQRAQEDVEGLLAGGDRSGAETRGQALCRAIDEAFEQGLSQEELMTAIAKRQHVMALIAGQAEE
ncbi:MAG: hypothetical protein A2X52_09890 [Candidatus Rokubacteria bacterium GWC2_70_16]|nr:MAG: hypothetical protein A2X52_09890 [Candidatus Rokubacteria bacterium GWC2_70_16]